MFWVLISKLLISSTIFEIVLPLKSNVRVVVFILFDSRTSTSISPIILPLKSFIVVIVNPGVESESISWFDVSLLIVPSELVVSVITVLISFPLVSSSISIVSLLIIIPLISLITVIIVELPLESLVSVTVVFVLSILLNVIVSRSRTSGGIISTALDTSNNFSFTTDPSILFVIVSRIRVSIRQLATEYSLKLVLSIVNVSVLNEPSGFSYFVTPISFSLNTLASSSWLSFSCIRVISVRLPLPSITVEYVVWVYVSDDLSVNTAFNPDNKTPIDTSSWIILNAAALVVLASYGLVYIPSGKPLSMSIPIFCSYDSLSSLTVSELTGSNLDTLVVNNELIFDI